MLNISSHLKRKGSGWVRSLKRLGADEKVARNKGGDAKTITRRRRRGDFS